MLFVFRPKPETIQNLESWIFSRIFLVLVIFWIVFFSVWLKPIKTATCACFVIQPKPETIQDVNLESLKKRELKYLYILKLTIFFIKRFCFVYLWISGSDTDWLSYSTSRAASSFRLEGALIKVSWRLKDKLAVSIEYFITTFFHKVFMKFLFVKSNKIRAFK